MTKNMGQWDQCYENSEGPDESSVESDVRYRQVSASLTRAKPKMRPKASQVSCSTCSSISDAWPQYLYSTFHFLIQSNPNRYCATRLLSPHTFSSHNDRPSLIAVLVLQGPRCRCQFWVFPVLPACYIGARQFRSLNDLLTMEPTTTFTQLSCEYVGSR